MADTYVDVGPMAFSKDTKKVAAKYTKNAKKLMHEAALRAIRGAAGFTADKEGPGFHVDATLSEVSFGTFQGQPSVTCKLLGVVATYPEKKWLTQSLKGSATIAPGASDRDVDDCISEAMDGTMKERVISFLRQQPKP